MVCHLPQADLAIRWNDVGDIVGSHAATVLYKLCDALAALGGGDRCGRDRGRRGIGRVGVGGVGGVSLKYASAAPELFAVLQVTAELSTLIFTHIGNRAKLCVKESVCEVCSMCVCECVVCVYVCVCARGEGHDSSQHLRLSANRDKSALS